MAKSDLTIELERKIWSATHKQGVFRCFEVTIGWFGKERVDYITYDTKGVWRCYEIKVSKADFHSRARKTFIGNYNYYVMPKELYLEIKDEIPDNIGVHNGICCLKKAKRQELTVDEQILKDSMIRSLSREFEKQFKSGDITIVAALNKKINQLQRTSQENYNRYLCYSNAIFGICDKYNINYDDVREIVRKTKDLI